MTSAPGQPGRDDATEPSPDGIGEAIRTGRVPVVPGSLVDLVMKSGPAASPDSSDGAAEAGIGGLNGETPPGDPPGPRTDGAAARPSGAAAGSGFADLVRESTGQTGSSAEGRDRAPTAPSVTGSRPAPSPRPGSIDEQEPQHGIVPTTGTHGSRPSGDTDGPAGREDDDPAVITGEEPDPEHPADTDTDTDGYYADLGDLGDDPLGVGPLPADAVDEAVEDPLHTPADRFAPPPSFAPGVEGSAAGEPSGEPLHGEPVAEAPGRGTTPSASGPTGRGTDDAPAIFSSPEARSTSGAGSSSGATETPEFPSASGSPSVPGLGDAPGSSAGAHSGGAVSGSAVSGSAVSGSAGRPAPSGTVAPSGRPSSSGDAAPPDDAATSGNAATPGDAATSGNAAAPRDAAASRDAAYSGGREPSEDAAPTPASGRPRMGGDRPGPGDAPPTQPAPTVVPPISPPPRPLDDGDPPGARSTRPARPAEPPRGSTTSKRWPPRPGGDGPETDILPPGALLGHYPAAASSGEPSGSAPQVRPATPSSGVRPTMPGRRRPTQERPGGRSAPRPAMGGAPPGPAMAGLSGNDLFATPSGGTGRGFGELPGRESRDTGHDSTPPHDAAIDGPDRHDTDRRDTDRPAGPDPHDTDRPAGPDHRATDRPAGPDRRVTDGSDEPGQLPGRDAARAAAASGAGSTGRTPLPAERAATAPARRTGPPATGGTDGHEPAGGAHGAPSRPRPGGQSPWAPPDGNPQPETGHRVPRPGAGDATVTIPALDDDGRPRHAMTPPPGRGPRPQAVPHWPAPGADGAETTARVTAVPAAAPLDRPPSGVAPRPAHEARAGAPETGRGGAPSGNRAGSGGPTGSGPTGSGTAGNGPAGNGTATDGGAPADGGAAASSDGTAADAGHSGPGTAAAPGNEAAAAAVGAVSVAAARAASGRDGAVTDTGPRSEIRPVTEGQPDKPIAPRREAIMSAKPRNGRRGVSPAGFAIALAIVLLGTLTAWAMFAPGPTGDGRGAQQPAADGTPAAGLGPRPDAGPAATSQSSPTVRATVPVGAEPVAVTANADGRTALVAVADDPRLLVLDGATDTVAAEIPLPAPPQGLTTSPDGTRAFVSLAGADGGQLAVVDLPGAAVLGTAETAADPAGAIAAPDGRFLYVPSRTEGVVDELDPYAGTVTRSVPVSRDPFAAATDGAGGRIYLATRGADQLTVLDPSSLTVLRSYPVSGGAEAVAVSAGPQSLVAVGGPDSDTVSVLDPADGREIAGVETRGGPTGLAFAPDGRHLYAVTDQGLQVIRTSTWRVTGSTDVALNPTAIAVSPDGRTGWVTGDGEVSVLDLGS
ncbi:hypothetical protein [Pseudonocardia sp. NPDC049635]|uniref:YncE family protein n=1 Tax=Pseudonocardia sp. NPDC049635 TaxID=3155506 RepID=UPI0033E66103